MFLFLHDVPARSGRPTVAARGSHRIVSYYSHVGLRSFFADAAVESRYDVVPLSGRAGGGFLLDTNTLHRATLGGGTSRTHPARLAIQLEWHPHDKVPVLATHPAALQMPCPTIKDGLYDWRAGLAGFPLYPPDQPPSQ